MCYCICRLADLTGEQWLIEIVLGTAQRWSCRRFCSWANWCRPPRNKTERVSGAQELLVRHFAAPLTVEQARRVMVSFSFEIRPSYAALACTAQHQHPALVQKCMIGKVNTFDLRASVSREEILKNWKRRKNSQQNQKYISLTPHHMTETKTKSPKK